MRSIAAAIGLFFMAMAGAALAQAPAAGDTGSREGDQMTRSAPSPTPPADRDRVNERHDEPPPVLRDEFEPPPAGCRYRENKLDLLV